MAKVSFREQVLRAREDAIVSSVNRLLAEKGFDLMTVDEVAADVGIAKASLYKHFTSKEELAAAAMIRVLDRAMAFIDSLATNKVYLDRLMEVSDRLGAWIGSAQAHRDLNPALPPEVILYTLFARACDPVLGLLKLTGQYSDEQIIELLVSTCFDGLSRR